MKTVASRLVAGLTAFALPAIAAITWGSISTAQAAPPNDYNGTATATVNGVTVATDYKIEQVATRGYATAQPNQVVLDSGSNSPNAVGVNVLPGNLPVEIEAIFELRD